MLDKLGLIKPLKRFKSEEKLNQRSFGVYCGKAVLELFGPILFFSQCVFGT